MRDKKNYLIFALFFFISFFTVYSFIQIKKESCNKVENYKNLISAFPEEINSDAFKFIKNTVTASGDHVFICDKQYNLVLENFSEFDFRIINELKKNQVLNDSTDSLTYVSSDKKHTCFVKNIRLDNSPYFLVSVTDSSFNFKDERLLFSLLSLLILLFWSIKKISPNKRKDYDEKTKLISEIFFNNSEISLIFEIDGKGKIKFAGQSVPDLLKKDIKSLKGKNICDFIASKSGKYKIEQILEFNKKNGYLKKGNSEYSEALFTIIPYNKNDRKTDSYLLLVYDKGNGKKTREELEDELKRIGTVAKICEMTSRMRSQSDIVRVIMYEVGKLIRFDLGIFFIKGEDKLVPYYTSEELSHEYEHTEIKTGEGIVGTVAETCKPLLLRQGEKMSESSASEIRKDAESVLAIPVFIKQKIFGVMYFSRFDELSFTDKDLADLNFLARRSEVIIGNSRTIRELRYTINNYCRLINETVVGIVIIKDKKTVFVNKSLKKKLGYEEKEIVGKNISDLIDERDKFKFFSVAATTLFSEEKEVIPVRFITADKINIMFEVTFGLINWDNKPSIIAVLIDISDRVMLNKKMFQNQRLISLGELASGIVHDLKNLIMIIGGSSEILLQKSDQNDDFYKSVKMIKKAAEHGAGLTGRILEYSQKNSEKVTVFDINKELQYLIDMLQPTLPANIKIESYLPEEILAFKGDKVKIQQCFINLCVNAKDAMPRGGKIVVSSSLIRDDEILCYGQKINTFIKIEIKDNGIGMSDEVKKHIFETFYTTKKQGKGTGLGLSTAKRIIDEYDGKITVESEEGKGSVFTILLPASEKEPEEPEDYLTEEAEETCPEHSLKILFVDDEKDILDLYTEILEEEGHEIIACVTVLEALRHLEEEDNNIDLIIADKNMPLKGGIELFNFVIENKKNIPVIITSGMTEDEQIKELTKKGLFGFISKPFSIEKIKKIINSICNNKFN
ncbi:MAG: hypothetical protein CSB55_04055 [Candidatus Cloacimonadota bacterium]|nr:MAG: hypothetical protein CSB55_04055 [Candidatus Cloacimonadota bacterium]